MEADLSTPVNPLEIMQDRERIKELRKERNKVKKQKQRAEKLRNPKRTPPVSIETSKHVPIVSKQFSQQCADSDNVSHSSMKRATKLQNQLPSFTLADVLKAETHSKQPGNNTQRPNDSKELHIVANILDKCQPIMSKGKHSEQKRSKRMSKLRKEITDSQQREDGELSLNTTKRYHYATNIVTDSLQELSTSFIADLVYLQEKYYKRDAAKAQMRKRYVAGFHQLKKYIIMKKLKLIVIARDIKTSPMQPLDNLIKSIQQLAEINEIPFVFVLSRLQIGRLLIKQVPVSCMGVLNYDGVNIKYKELLEEVTTCKLEYLRTQTMNAAVSDDHSSCNHLIELLKSELNLSM